MNRLIAFFVEKDVFVNLLTVFVIGVGLASLFLIRREVFPQVAFDVITVTTLAPGASAEEVEKLITNPIEQDMKEVDGIKKLLSKTVEGRSFIMAQLDPNQTTEAEGKADIKNVVDRIRLPAFAEEPEVVSADSSQMPIIEVALAGDLPPLELRTKARDLEKRLESIPGVARVVHSGLRDREVRVEADPRKLSRYRLSLDDLVTALKLQNVTISAGTLEAGDDPGERERVVRTVGEFTTLEEVGNTVIRANDLAVPIRVKDVARIFYDLQKATTLNRTNGKPSLSLTVLKKEQADAITVVDNVRDVAARAKEEYGPAVEMSFINDFSSFIRRRLSVLSGNLVMGLSLVMVLLGLTLRLRIALLVSIGIPFSFLGAMIIFHNAGFSLNLISLIGLIIVSGMLVDDAIVVTDNTYRLIEEGMEPRKAAITATQQIWPAVTASVLTTIVAFLPMMFMSGIFGKFVREIPVGVVAALLISLVESFFILPAHIATWSLSRKEKRARRLAGSEAKLSKAEQFWNRRIIPAYLGILRFTIHHRYVTAFLAVVVFAGSMALAVFGMRFVLFPPDGVEAFFVRMEAPRGSSLLQTQKLILPMEEVVARLPRSELKDYTTTIGIQQQDANDPLTRRGTEFAQIMVHLTPQDRRERTVPEIMDSLREPGSRIPGVRVSLVPVETGPPVGKPVSLSVRAEEYAEILPAVAEVKEILSRMDGVTDIEDSYTPGKEEIIVRVNGAEAAAAGLTVAAVGNSVRAAFEGIESTSIRGLDEEVKVRVSLPQGARSDQATLEKLLIPNAFNQLVPLSRISRLEKGRSLALYEHENNEREVKVTAEVDTAKTSAMEVNAKLAGMLKGLGNKYPGVRFAFGGEDEDTRESMQSLFRAFGVAALGVFLILVFTFQNLLQPMLVLTTIPLGLMSVVWTLVLHGRPLSFMSMLGVVALVGVIVNNAIIFIDFVNAGRAKGTDRFQSIFEAARQRVRPIFLTTATTVAGLMPTAYGVTGRDDFVVPIALSLGWGLLFGSFLTAILLPAAVAVTDDLTLLGNWFLRKLGWLEESSGAHA